MKKLFCILLALVMLSSLTACGFFARIESGTNNNEDSKTVEIINDGTPFSEGIAVVSHHTNHNQKFSVIDKEGNILCDFESEDYNIFHRGQHYYKNGVFVSGNIAYDKNGKVIASPEKSGYTNLLTDARVDGKMLAIKIEESDSGNKLYYGLLDNKGNWIEPLSSTHPIAKELENVSEESIDLYNAAFCTGEVVHIAENRYYNMKTGAITSHIPEFIGKSEYTSNGERYAVWGRDENGKETKVKSGVYLKCSFETGFIGCYSQNGDTNTNLYYFDENGNEIIDLKTEDIMDAKVLGGYLFACVYNDAKDYHTCVYKLTGETVIESMDIDGHFSELRVWDEYGLFGTDEKHIYNFSGEEITFEDYMIISFGEGLFFVAAKEDYTRAYLDMNGNKVFPK